MLDGDLGETSGDRPAKQADPKLERDFSSAYPPSVHRAWYAGSPFSFGTTEWSFGIVECSGTVPPPCRMSAGAGASALQDFLSSGAVCGPLHGPFFVGPAAQGPDGRESVDPSASITHSAQRADIDETLEPDEFAEGEEEEGEIMPAPANPAAMSMVTSTHAQVDPALERQRPKRSRGGQRQRQKQRQAQLQSMAPRMAPPAIAPWLHGPSAPPRLPRPHHPLPAPQVPLRLGEAVPLPLSEATPTWQSTGVANLVMDFMVPPRAPPPAAQHGPRHAAQYAPRHAAHPPLPRGPPPPRGPPLPRGPPPPRPVVPHQLPVRVPMSADHLKERFLTQFNIWQAPRPGGFQPPPWPRP